MTAKDELLKFIINLTPEQANKIVKHIDMLKDLTENQKVFLQTFAERVFTAKKEGVA